MLCVEKRLVSCLLTGLNDWYQGLWAGFKDGYVWWVQVPVEADTVQELVRAPGLPDGGVFAKGIINQLGNKISFGL